jgi:hypothetical protein
MTTADAVGRFMCDHDWVAMKNPFNDNGKSERLEECVHCHEIREAACCGGYSASLP